MSILKQMRSLRTKDVAVRTKFDQFLRTTTDETVIVVEGDLDPFFYKPEVSRKAASLAVHFARGKKQVLYLHQHHNSEPSQQIALFFCDKDHDDFLPSPPEASETLYITDHYSIENHICCEHVLLEILTEYLQIEREHIDAANILEKYRQNRQSLIDAIRRSMALLIASRRTQNQVNLSGLKLGGFYSFDNELSMAIQRHELELAVAYHLRPASETISEAELDRTVAEISTIPDKSWLRGKFELEFFLKFVSATQKFMRDHGVPTKRKEVSAEHLFTCTLQGRPISLVEFVDQALA